MQRAHTSLGDGRIGLLLVGFCPADRLAAVACRLGWTAPVLGDPHRGLYRRLGIGRAPWWRVYAPTTVAGYARARLAGQRVHRPVEDTRQLGGDAITVDGVVRAVWRPATPDDRPPAVEALTVAARLAERP